MQARETDDPRPLAPLVQKARVLLVEDEVLFARAVIKRLRFAGYPCERAESLEQGRELVARSVPDLALLDLRLPDGNGMELLPELVARGVVVIVMTAHGEINDAVQAMKQGATDYLRKPVDLEDLLLTIEKAQHTSNLRHQLDYSRQRDGHASEPVELLGNSAVMHTVRTQIDRLGRLMAVAQGTPPTVLISGETGTGKDVAARLLHQARAEGERPFVHVDCASLPAELIEGELFGHEKGAYTNAQGTRPGLIEAAENGTLFLDEIGEIPLPLQAKLLHVLERRVVRRLGSTRERPVAARFIAASNRDLQQMVLDGHFRADLYYRLNVLNLVLPPLRERGDDISLLARHFAAQTARRYGLTAPVFSEQALQTLQHYPWPGNVRELKHQVSRAVLLGCGASIDTMDLALPHATARGAGDPSGAHTLEAAEKTMIEDALRQTHGNVSEAARLLGITRMTIRYRMERHGLKKPGSDHN